MTASVKLSRNQTVEVVTAGLSNKDHPMPCNACRDEDRCHRFGVCQNLRFPLSRTDHVTSNAFIASACDAAGEVVALVAAEDGDELSKLRAFFREVAELTKEHDVLDDHAVVYPNKLGEALERVDPNWAGEVVALVPDTDGVGPCGEVQAWQHEDDPARVISAMQKAQALRDGGASASSVKPYSVPLTLGVPAVAPADLRQRFVDWWDHTYGDTKGPAFKAMAWEAAQAVAGVPACSTPSAGEPSQ